MSRKSHRLDYCRLSTLVLIACLIIWPASVLFFFDKSFYTWVNRSIIGIPCLLYKKNIYMGRYTYYVELGWKEGGRDTTFPLANQNLAIPALPYPNYMPSPRCHEGFSVASADIGYARRRLQGRERGWSRLGNGRWCYWLFVNHGRGCPWLFVDRGDKPPWLFIVVGTCGRSSIVVVGSCSYLSVLVVHPCCWW